jgi:hypothetical protein
VILICLFNLYIRNASLLGFFNLSVNNVVNPSLTQKMSQAIVIRKENMGRIL